MGTRSVWAWGQCGNRDGVEIEVMGTGGCGHGEGVGTRWWHQVVWRSRAWGQVWGQAWCGHGASEGTGMTGALGWHGDIAGTGTLWPGGQEQHGKSPVSAGCWQESPRGHQGHIVPTATPPHLHHHHLGTGCGGAGASPGTKLPLWAPAVGTGSRGMGGQWWQPARVTMTNVPVPRWRRWRQWPGRCSGGRREHRHGAGGTGPRPPAPARCQGWRCRHLGDKGDTEVTQVDWKGGDDTRGRPQVSLTGALASTHRQQPPGSSFGILGDGGVGQQLRTQAQRCHLQGVALAWPCPPRVGTPLGGHPGHPPPHGIT